MTREANPMQLLVTLPGQDKPIPLADCEWVLWDSCGCAAGAMYASAAPTEDAAWREWYPRKRDRDRARRTQRLEVMTRARWAQEVAPTMATPCPHRSAEETA